MLVAELELADGREEAGLAASRELCEQTHAKDDGCLLCALHRIAGEDTTAS